MVVVAIVAIVAGLIFVGVLSHLAKETGRNEGLEIIGRLEKEAETSRAKIDEQGSEVVLLTEKIVELTNEVKKTVSQKKSSEVRTGLIVEQMAPFLEGFPYEPRSAIFLGKPLDFLVFDDEGIHFVEVKSGNAQLNANQRKIRDQLKEKRVTFEVYRIKGG